MEKASSSERIDALKARYEADETLTASETEELRKNLSSNEWLGLLRAANARKNLQPIPITAGRTEAQIAADYRARTLELLEQLVNVITEARKDHSLTISFSISPPDAFGRCSIGMLEISKKLC